MLVRIEWYLRAPPPAFGRAQTCAQREGSIILGAVVPPIRCDGAPRAGDKTTRPMRDALNAELARASDDGEGHNVLQLIARKLAAKALEGDLGAIREVFDRLDGKTAAGRAADFGVLSDRCLR